MGFVLCNRKFLVEINKFVLRENYCFNLCNSTCSGEDEKADFLIILVLTITKLKDGKSDFYIFMCRNFMSKCWVAPQCMHACRSKHAQPKCADSWCAHGCTVHARRMCGRATQTVHGPWTAMHSPCDPCHRMRSIAHFLHNFHA